MLRHKVLIKKRYLINDQRATFSLAKLGFRSAFCFLRFALRRRAAHRALRVMQRSVSTPIFALMTDSPLSNGKARAPLSKERVPQMIPTPEDLQTLQKQVRWGLEVLSKTDDWFQYITHEEAVRAASQNWAVIGLLASMEKEERKRSFDNTKPTLIIIALVQLAVCMRNDDQDYIVMSHEAQQMYNATAIRDRLLAIKMQHPKEWKVYDDDGRLLWSMIPDVKSGTSSIDGAVKAINIVDGVDGPKRGNKEALLYKREVYTKKLKQYSELLLRAVGVALPSAILEGNNPCILADGYEPSRRELVRREVAHRANQGRLFYEARNEERKKGFFARFGYTMHRHPCARPPNSGEALPLDKDGLVVMDDAEVLDVGEDERDEDYDARLAEAVAARTAKINSKKQKKAVAEVHDESEDEDEVRSARLSKERNDEDDRLIARLVRIRAAATPSPRGEGADLED